MIMRHIGCAALIFGAVTLVAAPKLNAQGTTIFTPAQLEKAAALDLQNGNWARAELLSQGLLRRDPDDVAANLVRSRALLGLRQFDGAQDAARVAWKNAGTALEKYNSALLMAQALSSDGKKTRAQLWLRRAVEHAPTQGHENRAKQDFKYVQRRNPWQTYLSFTLAPNSNINNGSSRDSFVSDSIFGRLTGGGPQLQAINPEAQALSGIEFGVQIQTRYRFSQTERRAHDLRFGLSYRGYALSSSSKSDAPGVDGSDFAFGTASIGYSFSQLRKDGRGELSAGAELGQIFYGGARYTSYLRGTVAQSYYISRQTKLRFGLTAETENGQRVSDSDSLSLSFNMDRALSNGNGLNIGITVTEQISDNSRLEYSQARVRAGYIFGKPVMGATLQLGLGARVRDYDVDLLSFDGRRDVEVSADISATFRQIDYYGFNPRVSLTASKTNSNIGVFDVNRVGLSIGIASSF